MLAFFSYWIGWIPKQAAPPTLIMQLLGHLDGREATELCAFALFFCTASTKRRDSLSAVYNLSETPHLPLAICPFAEIGHISWSHADRTSQLRVNLKIRRTLPPHPKKKSNFKCRPRPRLNLPPNPEIDHLRLRLCFGAAPCIAGWPPPARYFLGGREKRSGAPHVCACCSLTHG